MEPLSQQKYVVQLSRQLANLKLVSRLLAHEMHAQQTSKTITLSKDEVGEIQTCIDLFIEEAARQKGALAGTQPVDGPLATARINN